MATFLPQEEKICRPEIQRLPRDVEADLRIPTSTRIKSPRQLAGAFYVGEKPLTSADTYFCGRSAGKRMTSRMVWLLVKSITRRSMPIP